MCAKNKNIFTWPEQTIIEWSRLVISIVACCRGAKLCAHAAQDFRSQQNGAVTRMWRSCQGSDKERAIGVVRCKKEGMLLQPLRWCSVDCVIHHERDVREEQKYMYVAWTSNNRVISSSGDLYCCLLPLLLAASFKAGNLPLLKPRCKALRTCRSGFPIATVRSTSSHSVSTFFWEKSHENFVEKRLSWEKFGELINVWVKITPAACLNQWVNTYAYHYGIIQTKDKHRIRYNMYFRSFIGLC